MRFQGEGILSGEEEIREEGSALLWPPSGLVSNDMETRVLAGRERGKTTSR